MLLFDEGWEMTEGPEPFIAHKGKDDDRIQSVSAHNRETACAAAELCAVKDMAPIAYLAGRYHDAGKYSEAFQEYIRRAGEEGFSGKRGDVNHATAGGILVEETAPGSNLSEMIRLAVYSHHGVYDAISLGKGESLVEKRQSESYLAQEHIQIESVRQRFYQFANRESLNMAFLTARESLKRLMKDIKSFSERDTAHVYGSRDFYLGMHERLLMSLLIDADRSNTAQFMDPSWDAGTMTEGVSGLPWRECVTYFEVYIAGKFQIKTKIDSFRKEISETCLREAECGRNLYRLTLPTGSGKTLSGLRFALHHAKKYEKKRIIYVAPYQSILEQNANEIRDAVGNPELVLEHHCNVIPDGEAEQHKYDRLTENWSSPIIATTAVQFLNTLFSSKTGSIRRMHRLCDSIILFDEVQSLPVQVISLFNLAVNYLTSFCNTTVVLCSATQPVFDKLPQNRLLPPKEIVEEYVRYDFAFRRVTVIDKTKLRPGGLSVDELGEFILDRFPEEKQMLVIVNTKSCARNLYDYLKKRITPDCAIFHLSTNMCALHRGDVLDRIRTSLEDDGESKPVICISTQLIEAGVDLSFCSVIRSLAGLDSVIQAAGRCNRHGKQENGNVYVVKMSQEAEHVSSLKEIREAQQVMEDILRRYEEQPDTACGDLLSDKAKQQYYLMYLQKQGHMVDFPVNAEGASATIVDLLSGNQLARNQYIRKQGKPPKRLMKQAFKTAGDLFEVISEVGKEDVVVPYNDEIVSLIEEIQNPYLTLSQQKKIIRRLQLATVGISEQLKNRLGRAVTPVQGGLVNILNPGYYSEDTGVCEEPVGMQLLSM